MKERVQSFGRALSGMVMPNIGAFIAWGIITALFIETGWLPNEQLATIVDPMSKFLLLLLIAYTGGKMIARERGGVMAAIATFGIIIATDVPMFLGAMIMGPLAGWIIKKFDKLVEGKVKAGFEMLVNNFSIGIFGAILAILAFYAFAPVVNGLTSTMAAGVGFFVNHGLLPVASIFIEPAKVLFLNNAINHGILSPMGIEQVGEIGKSIFFLMEANPGPGLGILLAYCIAGKGNAKTTAPGAVIIHFLGGIHEIYFPFILMNPALLISAILAGASGIFTFTIFNVGLVSPASPGSILAVLAMTPKGDYLGIIAGVLVSTAVALITAIPLIKFFGKEKGLEEAQAKKDVMKAEAKGLKTDSDEIKLIVFACDAGMGSSAMGATVLRKKLKEAGRDDISVEHASVSTIPQDAQIVLTHESLKERARNSAPMARVILISNFMSAPQYDELVKELKR